MAQPVDEIKPGENAVVAAPAAVLLPLLLSQPMLPSLSAASAQKNKVLCPSSIPSYHDCPES